MLASSVIKDHNGSPIVVGTCNLRANTIYVIEALTLRDALKFAKVNGFKDVCVESDFKLVIDSILNKCKMLWGLKTIIEDRITGMIIFFYILDSYFREVNIFVDAITSVGHSIYDLLFGI